MVIHALTLSSVSLRSSKDLQFSINLHTTLSRIAFFMALGIIYSNRYMVMLLHVAYAITEYSHSSEF